MAEETKVEETKAGETTAVEETTKATEGGDEKNTIETLLSNPDVKADYDKKIADAVATALEAANKTAQEAEKMSGMSEDEKKKYEDGKKENALAEREKALVARELKATAVEEFGKEQIPAALADCIDYTSQDTFAKTKEVVVKAFRDAVKEAVNTRLRGSNPPKSGVEGENQGEVKKTSAEEFVSVIKTNQSKR
ncbi:MAG: DUF4355 domain-containing protein [Lachnospiraceae bacterium]|nr:DUF4355 domain-containing protein [Lachnospiraceae bacterium]